MSLLGFTPKLRLAPVWPALAAVLTGALLLGLLLPGLFERSASVQLLDTLHILTPVVSGRLDVPDGTSIGSTAPDGQGGDLRAWLRQLADGSDLRLTLIAADGTVLADSAAAGRLANHADRPEVRDALADGTGTAVRTSATTGQPYVYAARTFTGPRGQLYLLRLAQPLEQLHDLRGRLGAAVVLALAAAGLALLLVSLWIDRRLLLPLSQMIAGAGELASGRYSYRVQVPDEDELADLALSLNRLGATVEGQLALLGKERDHLRAILAGMSEGVLVVGRDGRAQFANPAFHRLFDLQGDVAGRQVLEIVRQPVLAQLVDDTLAGARGQSAEIELRQGPDRKSLQLVSAALSDEGGQESGGGAVVVARDTTELNRLTEVRRDFVANVSHELKTPLAAIRGYAETLRDGAAAEPETAARFLDRILVQCRRLQALLDDLLTLSRLESVDQAPRREPVDLAALVAHAADLVSAAAAEKQIRVAVEPPPPLPAIHGDPDALERMLVNLLDNAVKYNHPGGTVKVRLRRLGGSTDGQVQLEVRDTGIGIPHESLARIFERFYRVDKGRSRAEGGTGLGLAIVKHVVQTHGGQVEVESRMGQGTTFRVRLPLGEAAA